MKINKTIFETKKETVNRLSEENNELIMYVNVIGINQSKLVISFNLLKYGVIEPNILKNGADKTNSPQFENK